MFRCEIYCVIQTSKGGGYGSRWIDLPFAPVAGMELIGIGNDSELQDGDGDRIKRVSWRHDSQTFLVEIGGLSDREDEEEPASILTMLFGDQWEWNPWPVGTGLVV